MDREGNQAVLTPNTSVLDDDDSTSNLAIAPPEGDDGCEAFDLGSRSTGQPTRCVTVAGMIRSKGQKPLARPKRYPAEKQSDHGLITTSVEKSRISGRTGQTGTYPQAPKITPLSASAPWRAWLTPTASGSAHVERGKTAPL
jgi:hypothetical protein